MQSGKNEPSPWSVNTPPKLTGGLRKRGEPGGTVLRKGFLFECLVFTRRLWNSEFFCYRLFERKGVPDMPMDKHGSPSHPYDLKIKAVNFQQLWPTKSFNPLMIVIMKIIS